MDEPNRWADMYRSHTCFKGLSNLSDRLRAGDHVRMKNAEVPPCRACRAWWAQCCHRFQVTAEFSWPGGRWEAHAGVRPPCPPHNLLLEEPLEVDGMWVFAEENQRCARWAVPGGPDASSEPQVYQSDLGDDAYGPWRPLRVTRTRFLDAFRLWNEANGGAPVSAFGERGEDTGAALGVLPIVLHAPHLLVYASGDTLVGAAGEEDIYVWGDDEREVRTLLPTLALKWDDLET